MGSAISSLRDLYTHRTNDALRDPATRQLRSRKLNVRNAPFIEENTASFSQCQEDIGASGESAEPKREKEHKRALSKRACKRLAREAKFKEQKLARKERRRSIKKQRKVDRRAERTAALALCDVKERERIQRERIEIMQAGRDEERAKRENVRRVLATQTKFSVCIDLGWSSKMTDKERKSLARQIAYSYSALRKGVEDGLVPLSLKVVGLDQEMKENMTSAASGWENWPVVTSEEPLTVHEDGKQLVYLTHDSENVLEELDEHCIYVIGGIVDRNRLKGATANKATQLNIPTARFNLDSCVQFQKGSPVLTVNHCVDILLRAANGLSWQESYLRVLPDRKHVLPAP